MTSIEMNSSVINGSEQSYQHPRSENIDVAKETILSGDPILPNGEVDIPALYQQMDALHYLDSVSDMMNVDRRVSLTVRPRIYNVDDAGLTQRVQDILNGLDKTDKELSRANEIEYGELFTYYKSSYGIIFPYTPKISGLGRTVNYEDVDILYSNMKYKQFKNSTPEKITINAKFTADTVTNAAAMLHAIWFLNACSMCKFGKESGSDAGLPPPILYLKAYDSLIDNIPVVITSHSYSLEDKDQYVQFKSKGGRIYWLPMICSITIQLEIQPNIKKTYETWTLDKYKKGDMFNNIGSNPHGEFIPSGWTW